MQASRNHNVLWLNTAQLEAALSEASMWEQWTPAAAAGLLMYAEGTESGAHDLQQVPESVRLSSLLQSLASIASSCKVPRSWVAF